VRNLLSATILSTPIIILNTASPGICGFSDHILSSLGSNGSLPTSNVLLGQAGNLYGTIEGGADARLGQFLRISANRDKTVIWNFSSENGALISLALGKSCKVIITFTP
jgi:hypothetical protein